MTTLYDIDSVMAILNSESVTQEPDFLHSKSSFDIYQFRPLDKINKYLSFFTYEMGGVGYRNDTFLKELWRLLNVVTYIKCLQ